MRRPKYNCAEQFMMHTKARVFGDGTTGLKIMETKNPREQKALGRTVKCYDDATWKAVARDVMMSGLVAKFTQNADLGDILVGTGDILVVEASPYDTVWGVGLGEDDPRILDVSQWRGANWLGEVLMRTRSILRNEAVLFDPVLPG